MEAEDAFGQRRRGWRRFFEAAPNVPNPDTAVWVQRGVSEAQGDAIVSALVVGGVVAELRPYLSTARRGSAAKIRYAVCVCQRDLVRAQELLVASEPGEDELAQLSQQAFDSFRDRTSDG